MMERLIPQELIDAAMPAVRACLVLVGLAALPFVLCLLETLRRRRDKKEGACADVLIVFFFVVATIVAAVM